MQRVWFGECAGICIKKRKKARDGVAAAHSIKKKWPAFFSGPGWIYYLATVVSLVLPHFGHLACTLVFDQAYTSRPHFEQMHASLSAPGLGGRSSFPHSGHRSSGIVFTSRIRLLRTPPHVLFRYHALLGCLSFLRERLIKSASGQSSARHPYFAFPHNRKIRISSRSVNAGGKRFGEVERGRWYCLQRKILGSRQPNSPGLTGNVSE